jgi:hypothetical protein
MPMRIRRAAGPVAVFALVAATVLGLSPAGSGASPSDGSHAIAVGSVRLSGSQEVPPTTSPGFGRFSYFAAGDTLCYVLTAFALGEAPVAAHIHVAPAGSNGPIVVGLELPDPISADCIKAEPDSSLNSAMVLTQEELDAIIANEAGYYANVHTAMFPGGAIRGQLR